MLTVSEAAKALRSFDQVLILTHVRPDGDTVGCAAALCAGLRALGKTAYLLPNPELTKTSAPYFQPYEAPADFLPEKIVSTDIATVALLPENAKCYVGHIDLAIDHHPSFEHFGAANIVRPEAAACGELLYDILAALGPITAEIALPLYVAVSTDTGCFAYANTTADTHAVAAALMRTGIDYHAVNKVFFRTKSRKRMQLEGAMLGSMEFHDCGRVAVLSVPISLMERVNATESDAEDLSALGGQIEGVDCAITMRELRPDVWKMSVRTGSRVNATKVCQLLGGGGHAAAAGCTVEAPWPQAKQKILDAVARTVGELSDETASC
jgi:phosphoesterase RecJ-like protein